VAREYLEAIAARTGRPAFMATVVAMYSRCGWGKTTRRSRPLRIGASRRRGLAFSSATHDIAADGFYMLALPSHEQAWFVGIRSTFYRIAMIAGQGLLVMIALSVICCLLRWRELGDLQFWYDDNAYGSIVWTLTGFHVAHVTVAILKSIVVLTLAWKGYFSERRYLGVQANAFYWYFVVLGSLVLWLKNRRPRSLSSGIDDFRREMRALAPGEEPDRPGIPRTGR
jgi:heme/copper-type cytochrome/quinol oxidase subunit 3